jgi:serine/threonine-protein kinase
MAYCHECGREVAEIDVFCPYCGVSLEPVSLGGQETDDAYANTIVIEQSSGSAEAAELEAAAGTGDDFGEIPTPLFIERGGEIPASAEAEETAAAESVEDPENEPDDLAADGVEPDDKAIADGSEETPLEAAADTGEMNEPGAGAEEEGPLSAGTETAGDDAGEEKEAAEEAVFVSTEGEQIADAPEEPIGEICGDEVDEVVLQAESETADAAEDLEAPEPEQTPEDAKKAAKSSGDLYAEISPFSDPGISKPLEGLDSEYPSPAIFDSVRIMDSDPKNSTAASQSAEAPAKESSEPEKQDAASAASPEAGKDKQSFTTPNMGGSDTDGKRSSKLRPLDEGTVLNGRYEIVRKIGGGGMGAVYLASDNNLGGVLRAVKEMVQAHIEEEQQDKAINDFKRESMILSTLDHPSIPTIYDYFFDNTENRFYLVMKYISGGDLSSRLRSAPEGRIDERTITEWAIQIADVLDYLHNRPSTIVYRDLKPSNVMLDGNTGRVMLIDFGIARSINQVEEKGVTAVGTMGYAPPELFSGNVEPRSDIYSLGSTMFHLLTGADPQNNPLLIFDFQKNPRPRQINPQLSDQIERILMHSVEYNAHTRFSSAAEMRQVLEEHLENLKTGRVTYGVKEIPASVGLANQPVFCGFCGQKIVATDMFCAFCGAKQPLAQHGVHAEIYARSAPTARLVIIGTNELDTPAFTLEKDESLVGRRDPMSNIFPEIDLSKFDPQTKISRRHAKIWREGNSYLVEDLGSSNGTILLPVVNDTKRLPPHQPHVLANGDKIRLGDTTLHFVIG